MSRSSPEREIDFKSLKTREDLSELLNVSDRGLRHLIYAIPSDQLYSTFNIGKRSGGFRTITTPVPRLKNIQRRLLRVLSNVYSPKSNIYGFVQGRNIADNARQHIRRKFVLNIDLEDFFGSINFGRVRGMFLAWPYECTPEVATVLARICCHNNTLPQGAPTSPVVSNMVCARLDSHLSKLARRYKARYTRYADDITFSVGRGEFPTQLANILINEGRTEIQLGRALRSTIENNGFRINEAKTRVQKQNQRQVVTGLVTNAKVNVPREYIRNARAMLRNWELDGIKKCQEKFEARNLTQGGNQRTSRSLKEHLKGQIDFIGAIRGKDDTIYLRLVERLMKLDYSLITPAHQNWVRSLRDRDNQILDQLWIVESTSFDRKDCEQGTGFFLEGFGLVTCAHCIFPDGETIIYSRRNSLEITAQVRVINDVVDLAILEVPNLPEENRSSFPISLRNLESNETITIAGFPHYSRGHSGIIERAKVIGNHRGPNGVKHAITNANIISGNSGGPIFDSEWKVVGVAFWGNKSAGEGADRNLNKFITIDQIFKLETTQR
jgi:RNA-directed DNA polymerase